VRDDEDAVEIVVQTRSAPPDQLANLVEERARGRRHVALPRDEPEGLLDVSEVLTEESLETLPVRAVFGLLIETLDRRRDRVEGAGLDLVERSERVIALLAIPPPFPCLLRNRIAPRRRHPIVPCCHRSPHTNSIRVVSTRAITYWGISMSADANEGESSGASVAASSTSTSATPRPSSSTIRAIRIRVTSAPMRSW